MQAMKHILTKNLADVNTRKVGPKRVINAIETQLNSCFGKPKWGGQQR
jgi:hypothetical protein